ncbi:MAG: hypothetical protein WCF84_02265 [Anaerolineae bacterium]
MADPNTDEQHTLDEQTTPSTPSRLVIEFEGPGSAQFSMAAFGVVTPAQCAALAAYLTVFASRAFETQLDAQARQRIARPGMVMPGLSPSRRN